MDDTIIICDMHDGTYCVTSDSEEFFDVIAFASEKEAEKYCASLGYKDDQIKRTSF